MRTPVPAMFLLVACQGDGDTDPGQTPDARINEVMASNQAAIEAPDGTFPDWFELANFGANAVDLSGSSLTDDPADPTKFVFPAAASLAAGEYRVIWADGDGLGPDTVPFKLAAAGESVSWFGPDGAPWDTMAFGPQETDVAWARSPDGGELWATATPSPGEPNP